MNAKLAVGMKKAVNLIINKMSVLVRANQKCNCVNEPGRIRKIAREELDLKIKDLKDQIQQLKVEDNKIGSGKQKPIKTTEVVKLNLMGISKRKSKSPTGFSLSRKTSMERNMVPSNRLEEIQQKINNIAGDIKKNKTQKSDITELPKKLFREH